MSIITLQTLAILVVAACWFTIAFALTKIAFKKRTDINVAV